MTKINTIQDSETPSVGHQVITACAFIHKKFDGVEKVFLPKRALTKMFLPGVYELPGGHIEFGENIVEGLKREIKEEFEMEVSIGDPFYVFTYLNNIKGSHSIEVIYFAEFTSPIENILVNPNDHSEFRWISENEIDQIVDQNKNYDDEEIKALLRGFSLINNVGVKLK